MGLLVSASTVGRILTDLRRRGRLREPVGRRISARKRRPTRPHATRKPRDDRVERPGDLVELDTLDVRPPGVSHPYRQFTARDVVSRWDVLELRRNATARAAASVLEAILARMPFEVRAMKLRRGLGVHGRVRGGVCRTNDPALRSAAPQPQARTAPSNGRTGPTPRSSPRSPTPNPSSRPTLAALADWEICYNTVRPHQALGYLTPPEWLVANGYLPAEV